MKNGICANFLTTMEVLDSKFFDSFIAAIFFCKDKI